MTNVLYTKAKQKFLEGHFNLPSDTINASLVDTGLYTVDLANHDFRNDIPDSAVIATQPLASKTVTDGVFNAANTVFPNVPASANTIEAVVVWKDTGTPTTSALIAYIDSGVGLPTTPNDGNITVAWDVGVNKIFRLT